MNMTGTRMFVLLTCIEKAKYSNWAACKQS